VRARHQGDEATDGDRDADRGEGALTHERFEVDGSRRSTPRNMITNKKSTTMAPA